MTPRVGLLYALAGGGRRTVEPPLLLELTSYGNAGGFADLAAQDAWQYEVGARGQRLGLGWELSVYDVELRNEIVNRNVQPYPSAPFTVPTYRNAPRTRHAGIEAGLAYVVPGALFVRGDAADRLTLRGAYTLGRYTYVRDAQYAGHDIPGAPRHYVTAEARYEHPSAYAPSERRGGRARRCSSPGRTSPTGATRSRCRSTTPRASSTSPPTGGASTRASGSADDGPSGYHRRLQYLQFVAIDARC